MSTPELSKLKLSEAVTEAQQFLDENDSANLEDLFNIFLISHNLDFLTQTNWKDQENRTTDNLWIAVGLLGLLRIKHVRLNQQLKQETQNQDKAKADEIFEQIKRLPHLHMDLTNMPPVTIHENGIFWKGEVGQDMGNTLSLIGQSHEGKSRFRHAIASTTQYLDTRPMQLSKELENYFVELGMIDEIGERDDLLEIKSRIIAGIQSSMAVNMVRLGLAEGDVKMVFEGLSRQEESMTGQNNVDRLIDLNQMVLVKSGQFSWLYFPDILAANIQTLLKHPLKYTKRLFGKFKLKTNKPAN